MNTITERPNIGLHTLFMRSMNTVGEPERHHHELVMPVTSPERCLLDIFIPNPHLVISRPQVYLGEPRRSLQLIEQIINPRQWIMVLDCQLVQLPVINAHPV